ncbi:intraflagellar transport protein 25 homolog [Gigantopelta aegis]|uniref:intraflagellar transport protein 25 homolog n=1 Tax=Gigantopelta aegis TaxID=1735272 RepID=UPI001B889C30|nr:intraflagellar transport protein 25 homolog [Gigantopelta aegis]
MFDVALASAGASVILATSSDDKYPPENMLDGNTETFWTTTGLFPQEFIIKFETVMTIEKVHISSYNVRKMRLEVSEHDVEDKFEILNEREFEATDSQLQEEDFKVGNRRALSLRVVIESGYDHFVSIHKVTVNGNALHG